MGPPGTPTPAVRKPVYVRIADGIVRRIIDGELRADRPIPSEKTLMRQHGVAKATVRQAVKLLREQGWVFTVAHRGTYVSDPEARSGSTRK